MTTLLYLTGSCAARAPPDVPYEHVVLFAYH